MTLSFEGEVRAYLAHKLEHDPTANAMLAGTKTVDQLGVQDALEMLARALVVQKDLILRAAQEIDKLRAATSGG